MKPTTLAGLLAAPLVIGGLYWLMVSGHLTLAIWLLALAVVGLIAGTGWEWRHGHRRWAALLAAGAVVTVATVGWYGWNLNSKLAARDRGRAPGQLTGLS